jgi:type I restriction enzyme M protein
MMNDELEMTNREIPSVEMRMSNRVSLNSTFEIRLSAFAPSSNQSGEGEIRRALIESDLVDCMVALPGQLFCSTQIPVCLWFLAKSKAARKVKTPDDDLPDCIRDRRKETLFIDARKMGTLIDRVHRELTRADIEKTVSTYHLWRWDVGNHLDECEKRGIVCELQPPYADRAGFCKSATTAEIAAHGHVLTPGRYVGAEEIEDDGEPFEAKMPRLVAELHAQFAESAKLQAAIAQNLKELGYGSDSGKKETPAPISCREPRKDFRGQRAKTTPPARGSQV